MLAIFEEIKDKTENCGKEFETNEKKKKPYGKKMAMPFVEQCLPEDPDKFMR